jgi:hypothetical protein
VYPLLDIASFELFLLTSLVLFICVVLLKFLDSILFKSSMASLSSIIYLRMTTIVEEACVVLMIVMCSCFAWCVACVLSLFSCFKASLQGFVLRSSSIYVKWVVSSSILLNFSIDSNSCHFLLHCSCLPLVVMLSSLSHLNGGSTHNGCIHSSKPSRKSYVQWHRQVEQDLC